MNGEGSSFSRVAYISQSAIIGAKRRPYDQGKKSKEAKMNWKK